MSDSLLNKYTRPQTEPDDPQLETEDLGSFGWLRGMRERATMLELRKKGGNITAIGYAWIEKIEFDPSEGITIHALGQQVKIQGPEPQHRSLFGCQPVSGAYAPPSLVG